MSIGLPPIRQSIFDLGRDLMVYGPADDPVSLHLPKLLNKHLLRDQRDCPFEIGEAQHLTAEQAKQDLELPPAFEKFQRLLDSLRG